MNKKFEIAKGIMNIYNEELSKNGKSNLVISRYILYDNNNPIECSNQIMNIIKEFGTKLRISNGLLKDIATQIFLKYGYSCFSENTLINKLSGSSLIKTRITKIKLGDLIEVDNNIYEEVLAISKHLDRKTIVCRFIFEENLKNSLEISIGHIMIVIRNGKTYEIPSYQAQVNDFLKVKINDSFGLKKINKIDYFYSDKLINIRTKNSNIIANDVLCTSKTVYDFYGFNAQILNFFHKINKNLPQKLSDMHNYLIRK